MSFLFIQNESFGEMPSLSNYNDGGYNNRYLTENTNYGDPLFERGRLTTFSGTDRSWWNVDTPESADSDFWFHFETLSSSDHMIVLTDSSLNVKLKIKMVSRDPAILAPDDTIYGTGDTMASSNNVYHYDVKINFSTGAWEIYREEISYGKGTANGLKTFDPMTDMARIQTYSASSVNFNQIIVSEGKPTLGMRVITLAPNEKPADNTMLGDISTVNEIRINTDGMTTADTGDYVFGLDDVKAGIDLSKYNVEAVNVASTANCEALFDNPGMAHAVRVDGEVFTGHEELFLDTTSQIRSFKSTWEANPKTGQPWQTSDLNALETGVRVKHPRLGTMTVGKPSSTEEYGFFVSGTYEGSAWENNYLSELTSSDRPYLIYSGDDGTMLLSFGGGGNEKIYNSDILKLKLTAEDGSTYDLTANWDTGNSRYTGTDAALFTFMKANHLKRLYVDIVL